MAGLATYTDLLARVADWLGRADLTSRIPDFVTLAQARINRQARAKVMQTKSTSFSIANEYESVPTDFMEVQSFYLTSTTPRAPLVFGGADAMLDYTVTGQPKFFTVAGSQFRFAPVPSGTFTATLVYYAKPATLVATSQETNSLFPANADLYLYASLLEAEGYAGNDPRLPTWKAAYDDALNNLNRSNSNWKHGGPMATRPDGPVY